MFCFSAAKRNPNPPNLFLLPLISSLQAKGGQTAKSSTIDVSSQLFSAVLQLFRCPWYQRIFVLTTQLLERGYGPGTAVRVRAIAMTWRDMQTIVEQLRAFFPCVKSLPTYGAETTDQHHTFSTHYPSPRYYCHRLCIYFLSVMRGGTPHAQRTRPGVGSKHQPKPYIPAPPPQVRSINLGIGLARGVRDAF